MEGWTTIELPQIKSAFFPIGQEFTLLIETEGSCVHMCQHVSPEANTGNTTGKKLWILFVAPQQ